MAYVDGFLKWWMEMIDFPAFVLLLLLMVFGWVLYKTQANKENKFDFADMLRDDNGKPSSTRMAVFVCLGLSSWALMYLVINNKHKVDVSFVFVAFMIIWSGQKVAEKFLDVWALRLGGGPPAEKSQTPTPPDNDSQ